MDSMREREPYRRKCACGRWLHGVTGDEGSGTGICEKHGENHWASNDIGEHPTQDPSVDLFRTIDYKQQRCSKCRGSRYLKDGKPCHYC
jgi:hypothetical protein